MKLRKCSASAFTLAALVSFGASAHDEPTPAGKVEHEGPSIVIPASKITFQGTGYGQRGKITGEAEPEDKEITFFDAYGKIASTRHGTFLKWPPGFKSPVHAHTYDYFAIVLKGTMLNYVEGSKDRIPLSAGSYWFQTGEQMHVTECISKEPCEGFLYQAGGQFDALFPEKK
jgi:beta-alanine degradation protein BauB